jgi:hypothetical protein
MLYKRGFRKEKEVVTFLIKHKMIEPAWNLGIERHPCHTEAAKRGVATQRLLAMCHPILGS